MRSTIGSWGAIWGSVFFVALGALGCSRDKPQEQKPELTATTSAALTTGSSSIASNFNGTAIASGTTLWFTAVAKVSGLPNVTTHLYVNGGQVTFSANSVNYAVNVPAAVITIDPAATQATTTFDTASSRWETTVPPSWSGNVFLAAVELPVTTALPGGINPVTWSANFQSDQSGLSVNWQWAAAVYTSFSSSYGALGVKPVDDTNLSQYKNSDHAGTPESYKGDVIGGARGGGGSNYTGSMSSTASVTPGPSSLCNGVTCTASDSCHVAGTCDPSTGKCSNPAAADGTTCAGTNLCDQTYTCQSGVCTGSNPVVCTASDQCHLAGTCEPTTGKCSNPNASDGTTCNDGNACTQVDTCQSGTCTGTNPVTCAAQDQCHVAGTCDPTSGACSNPAAADGTTCNDGNACTQTDTCQSGTCSGSNPVTCAASDQCHAAGTCDPTSGLCSNPPAPNGTSCSDGNACDLNDTCQSGVCTAGSHVSCTASDQCHVPGTCNPSTGQCSNPAAANGTACNDGNACDLNDTCQSGACTAGSHVTCNASDQCHVAGTCNPSTGQCSSPAAANGTACNDGNACTQADACQNGTCTGSNPVTCTAQDQCHAAGTCDPSTGTCSNPTVADGTTCVGSNKCDQTYVCTAGVCTGSNPVTCTAQDQCHVAGTCDPTTGTCSNPAAPSGTACNDGNACTQTDACQNGTCVGSNPITCAATQCQAAGTCDPATGTCSGKPVTDGTPCTGTDLCNQSYACAAGQCVGSNPVRCTPSDQCHLAGSCDPSTGACSNPPAANGTACNDDDACTRTDSCQSGVCQGGNPVTCAPLDSCHSPGTCSPQTGTCSNPSAPDGTSCGTTDAGQALVCMAGTCGAQPTCTPSQTSCHGLCVNLQSDSNNCGACGNACPCGSACAAGGCVSQAVLHSCLQTSNVSVLSSSDGVTLYLPWSNGWSDTLTTGIQRVVIEGQTIASFDTIPTPKAVDSCASNWVTGETVCSSVGTDVYLIYGDKIVATLTDGATGTGEPLSGGAPMTAGVAVDASLNTAILSISYPLNGQQAGAYQYLDLTNNTFSAPIAAGTDPYPWGTHGAALSTSENIAIDPVRHLVSSADESGDYQLLQYPGGATPFDNFAFTRETGGQTGTTGFQQFDSTAEDCTTGIGLATDEGVEPWVTLVDLTQAQFTQGSPKGTWSAPNATPLLPGTDRGNTGIAVVPGTHLAFLSSAEGSYGGGNVVALQLPSDSGSGTPALVDWASITLKSPNGTGIDVGGDPHKVTAYVDPLTGRALGVIASPLTGVIVIDLQKLLAAPRQPGTNLVDSSYDLYKGGVLDILTPCSGFDTYNDPNNCGRCGFTCPAGANALPACSHATCQIVCEPGFADCNGSATDCTTNLSTDSSNCGACGHSCAAPNATGTCNSGACTLTCKSGYNDCDGIESNGCETQGPCAPPVVSISGPSNVAVGDTPTYTAKATDTGRPLSYAWTSVSGPATVVFSAPDALVTTAEFTAAGTYTLQFEASDGLTTSAASLAVTATVVNHAPVVTVGADQTITAPTMAATLTGSAVDDGLPAGGTLSYTWSLVSGPAAVSIVNPTGSSSEPGPITANTPVTFAYPGTYVFQLDVSDGELDGTAAMTVTVNAPAAANGGVLPTVAIGGVTDDQEITKPTSILGTVSDGAWVLQYRLGGRDDVQTAYTVLASGTGPVNGSNIATLDPTLLLNGIYTLTLSAQNSAGSAIASVSLSVDQRMKIGNFTLTFTDLDTVVATLPLTITRTYDSRDKSIGDFGYGWHLGLRDVRIEKSGKIGAYWYQQFNDLGVFAQFCLYPTQAASVAVTFPNGRQYRFTPQSSPQCQYQSPLTTPDIVWTSTSDPDNATIQLGAGEGTSSYQGTPVQVTETQALPGGNSYVELSNLNTGDIWDPRQFTLTTEDGTVWQIDQDLGVTSVTDRHGNTLTVNQNGVVSSSGKQVTFARDAQKRITSITDPNGKAMSYAYDKNGDLATFTDRAGEVTQFAYAPNHYLTQIEDPLGRVPVRNEYDSNGRLISTTDASGNTVHYSPNLAANQDQVTDRLGHVTQYTYNDRGDITQKVDATGAVWNYSYDARGNQLTSTDPLGRTTTSTYDGADNLLTQTDALGNKTTNTYNGFKQLVTTTDPLGRVTTNEYDGSGNLIATTDPSDGKSHYTYDDAGDRITTTDALVNVTQYAYDESGHVTRMIDPRGNATTYTYDGNGKKSGEDYSRTNFNGTGTGVNTTYTYDALGRLTQTQRVSGSQAGSMSSTTYTPTGKRATSTDALGRVTSYTYDALDRLTQTAYPDGTTTSQTYDAENRRISSTDAAGNTTRYEYDPLGRLVRTTYADGTSMTTVYDAAGQAVQTIDELGNVRWSSYDLAGHLSATTDPLGNSTRYTYDAAGNRTSMTDPLGHVTSYTYDALNRLVATTYADGNAESTTYDADGRATSRVDTLGRTTQYGHDQGGNLVTVTDDLGNITRYTYDEAGARTSQKDANGHVTSFYYDFFTNALSARYLPDGAGETFSIDHAGEITQHKDFTGNPTRYAYDPMGRVLSRTHADGSIVSFTYTPTGQRQTATDARGTTSYAYDDRNRLVQLTYPDGRILNYGYDAHGDRTTLTAKIGSTSLTTTTAYDSDGRPNGVTDPLGRTFSFGYDAASNRNSAVYPNGTSTTYAYDERNRVTNIATTDGTTPVQSYAYTLDAAGRRTQIVEGGGTVRQYGYDGIDRLTSESVTGSLTYAKTFTYDAVGNRLTQVTTGAGAASVTYAYDSRDRLTTENTASYAYDPNGNVVSKSGDDSYTWDYENRLSSVTLPSGTTVSHRYDPDGNRVQTSVTPPVANTTSTCNGNSVVFAKEDTNTRGNWQGVYGADGQYIATLTPTPPSYGSATITGGTPYAWTTSTTDVRALQDPPPGTSRIASTTYVFGSTETFHVAINDGNPHTVAFYLLDWDNQGRSETITAQTPTGTVLDAARTFEAFSGGVYAVYQVCGTVDFVFDGTGNGNTVVSAAFFGPPPSEVPGKPAATNYLVDPGGCPSCGGGGALSQVVAETDSSGNMTAVYVRDQDELLEVMRPGSSPGTWTTRFVHHDGIGSVRALTDETGTTIDTRAYEAFGTKNVEAGNDPLAYGFAGEPFQSDSMLAYHRARWMDARVGRFDGMDPVATPVPPNLYVYADNQPTNRTDPTGREGIDAEPSFGQSPPPDPKIPMTFDLAQALARATASGVAAGTAKAITTIASANLPNGQWPSLTSFGSGIAASVGVSFATSFVLSIANTDPATNAFLSLTTSSLNRAVRAKTEPETITAFFPSLGSALAGLYVRVKYPGNLGTSLGASVAGNLAGYTLQVATLGIVYHFYDQQQLPPNVPVSQLVQQQLGPDDLTSGVGFGF